MAQGAPKGWTSYQVQYRDYLAKKIISKRSQGIAWPRTKEGVVLSGEPYALATNKVWRMIGEGRL